jgi:GNAT superfamily N-acetyltransferase
MKLIRKAMAGDASSMFNILVHATESGSEGFYPEDIILDWHRGRTSRGMAEVLLSEIFYVLVDDHEVKGYVHITEKEILGLFVDPSEHGKGYGKGLLMFALKEIKERPITILSTLNAVEFYAHFGFKKVKMKSIRRHDRDIYVWEMKLS